MTRRVARDHAQANETYPHIYDGVHVSIEPMDRGKYMAPNMAGRWLVDAQCTRPDRFRCQYNAVKVLDTEAEALAFADEWITTAEMITYGPADKAYAFLIEHRRAGLAAELERVNTFPPESYERVQAERVAMRSAERIAELERYKTTLNRWTHIPRPPAI